MSSWYINPARWTAFIQGITAQQAMLRLPWPARTLERIFIGSFSSAHTTAACVPTWRISSIRGVKQNRMEEELLWHSRQWKVSAEVLLPDSYLFYGSISEMGSCWSHLLAVRWARCWQPWLLRTAWLHSKHIWEGMQDYRKYSTSALAPKKSVHGRLVTYTCAHLLCRLFFE